MFKNKTRRILKFKKEQKGRKTYILCLSKKKICLRGETLKVEQDCNEGKRKVFEKILEYRNS